MKNYLKTYCENNYFCLGDLIPSIQDNYPNSPLSVKILPSRTPHLELKGFANFTLEIKLFPDDNSCRIELFINVHIYVMKSPFLARLILSFESTLSLLLMLRLTASIFLQTFVTSSGLRTAHHQILASLLMCKYRCSILNCV